jgi:hypothetical protein
MTDETEKTRRASDKVQNDIDALIAAENDPKQRALMIVLQSINRSLIANTLATQGIQIDAEHTRKDLATHLVNFQAHAVNEEAIMNKGKGAWWILSAALALAQGFAIYAWRESRAEIDAMQAQAQSALILHEKMINRIETLEKAK